MIVARGLTITEREGVSTLACEVSHGERDLPTELWIGAPGLPARTSWDPFLPTLALLAASRGRPLRIDGALSPQLLRGLDKILKIWPRWADHAYGRRLTSIPVTAQTTVRRREARGAASFFSGGVDSFFTLITNHKRYALGDPRRVTTLVVVQGLDIRLADHTLFTDVVRRLRAAAAEFQCETLVVRTNARAFLTNIDWVVYGHMPCLMAAAYHLSDRADSILVPAAYSADEVKPNAVHPLTDSLWSTEYLDVVHDGLVASRAEKVAAIAGSDVALRHLRVCFVNPEGAYNCGRCEKCLRTMMDLWISGALDRSPTFPRMSLEQALRNVTMPAHLITFWETSIARAEAAGLDAGVVAAARWAVERSAFDGSRAGRAMNRVLRTLERRGFTPASIKRADQIILRGAAQRVLRRLQQLAARGFGR